MRADKRAEGMLTRRAWDRSLRLIYPSLIHTPNRQQLARAPSHQ